MRIIEPPALRGGNFARGGPCGAFLREMLSVFHRRLYAGAPAGLFLHEMLSVFHRPLYAGPLQGDYRTHRA